jgi:glutamate formiminotransferase/formiminotetrahydrofolate cyclodeaminase
VANTISQSSLEYFRSSAASVAPTPAGVAIAAVSASFALGLLAKVANVSSRHKQFAANVAKLRRIADAATAESKRLLELADQDVTAFKGYVESSRLPQTSDREREARQRALSEAMRRAIEIPLAAARSAAAGLELCSEASNSTHTAVLADLGASASLLASAVRVFLMCADSNLRQMAADAAPFREQFAGRSEWEARAYRHADAVLDRVSSAINSLPEKIGRES